MNAHQLLTDELELSGVWLCSSCKFPYGCTHTDPQAMAERCCRCSYCQEPLTVPHSHIHPECAPLRDAENLQARIEKAQKLDEWDGWVFLEGWGSNNGFFQSLADLQLYAREMGRELPPYVFICEEKPFPGADMDDVIEHIKCEGYEDIEHDLDGVEFLQEAINVFNEANAARVSYFEDHTRMVPTKVKEEVTS